MGFSTALRFHNGAKWDGVLALETKCGVDTAEEYVVGVPLGKQRRVACHAFFKQRPNHGALRRRENCPCVRSVTDPLKDAQLKAHLPYQGIGTVANVLGYRAEQALQLFVHDSIKLQMKCIKETEREIEHRQPLKIDEG